MEFFKLNCRGVMADAIGPEHGIRSEEWEAMRPKIAAAQEALLAKRNRGELGFADIASAKAEMPTILKTAQHIRYRYDHMLVLGIGGSALGLRSMRDAMLNPSLATPDRLDLRSMPKLHICDNIDPDTFGPLLASMDWKKTCVNIISKSGKTAETAAQFLIVRDILQKHFGSEKWKEHVYITTDPASGPMRSMVICENLQSFSVPPNVGGRFSCLTPVGTFPAACAGIPISDILDGAQAMAEQCLSDTVGNNPAAMLAAVHCALATHRGKSQSVFMPYCDALRTFADWYIQLVAESLGKQGKGITPIPSLGATDQHSQMQLFMEGPNDKCMTIVTKQRFEENLVVPKSDEPVYACLGGHHLGAILNTEAQASLQALRENKRPAVHIEIPQLTGQILGQLFFCYEWMTALCGELFEIDAFNQPGVERGKILTREMLSADTQNTAIAQ